MKKRPLSGNKMIKISNWNLLFILLCSMLIQSCSVTRQIKKQATQILLNDSIISTGHIGISIYEPATERYWYNYNATKYFVPASNTKLFSLYAGMKYLGDSLVGLRYQNFSDNSINVFPTGDPTFLHPDFINQPILNFLKNERRNINVSDEWKEKALGYGWSWNDYNDDYMVERSPLPVYGNIATFKLNGLKFKDQYSAGIAWAISPKTFKDSINDFYALSLQLRSSKAMMDSALSKKAVSAFSILRNKTNNNFILVNADSTFTKQEIPIATNGVSTAVQILNTEFNLKINTGVQADNLLYNVVPSHLQLHSIKSQPSDSLFIPMMHRSDNFFAEQTLLMASNEKLGYMNDEAFIDTILNTDLKDIPQRPQWVDGSGLSRYNLFTPQDFIYILNKLKNDFGFERLKKILPTGGTGTLKRYFNSDSNFIYAKTGTLSNQVALSGFLITQKNKLLVFSILNNNYEGSTVAVRRAVEKFLQQIRKKY